MSARAADIAAVVAAAPSWPAGWPVIADEADGNQSRPFAVVVVRGAEEVVLAIETNGTGSGETPDDLLALQGALAQELPTTYRVDMSGPYIPADLELLPLEIDDDAADAYEDGDDPTPSTAACCVGLSWSQRITAGA